MHDHADPRVRDAGDAEVDAVRGQERPPRDLRVGVPPRERGRRDVHRERPVRARDVRLPRRHLREHAVGGSAGVRARPGPRRVALALGAALEPEALEVADGDGDPHDRRVRVHGAEPREGAAHALEVRAEEEVPGVLVVEAPDDHCPVPRVRHDWTRRMGESGGGRGGWEQGQRLRGGWPSEGKEKGNANRDERPRGRSPLHGQDMGETKGIVEHWLAVGGGWRRLAVGGSWRRLAVGGGWWRLAAVGGGWRLAVGGWRSLRLSLTLGF